MIELHKGETRQDLVTRDMRIAGPAKIAVFCEATTGEELGKDAG